MRDFTTRLANEHQTRDPFVIAKNLGIKIIEESLGKINGYYDGFIHINNNLPKWRKYHVAAYHLFDALTEKNLSFLSYRKELSDKELQKLQNMFAVALLSHDIKSFADFLEKAKDYEISDDLAKTLYARTKYIQGLLEGETPWLQ